MNVNDLSTLKIHKLTQAQYERELKAGRIDENALYLTPDINVYTQNNEPIGAPDGTLWVDLCAEEPKDVSGEIIYITDSAEVPLQNLKIFGKTTQNGTPTPEAPVSLESVGDTGSVVVKVCGKNLFDGSIPFDQMEYDTGGYSGQTFNVSHGTTVTISLDQKYAVGSKNGYLKVLGKTKEGKNTEIGWLYHKTVATYCNQKITFAVQPEWAIIGVYTTADAYVWAKDVLQVEIAETATAYEPYKTVQTLTCATPNGLSGIPVTSGGNYSDRNGQQWICDEVDFAKGVYIQRIGRIDSYAKEEIPDIYISTTGTLSAGATVLYVLTEVIEVSLTAEELAQYATMHTNYPSTTILNNGGAGMYVKYMADTKLMPILKVKMDNNWEEVGSNASTLDGKYASEFASSADVTDLQAKVGDEPVKEQIKSALSNFSSGKTLTEHLAEEPMVLSSLQYGDKLPAPGTPGRIFFLKVSE